MKQTLRIRQHAGRPGLLAAVLCFLFCLNALASGPASWKGTGGTVLLQHTGELPALGLQAFKPNAAAAQWTDIPENAGEWTAAAMDGNCVLFFYEPEFLMAVCTLDETGAPAEWLPLKGSFKKFIPVALEGNQILIQKKKSGELRKVTFNEKGRIVSKKRIWKESKGWVVRGVDSNRMILEHLKTGKVAIWASNPKAPLFRPYSSFTLSSGWSVRDFADDFVLIQRGKSGAVKLVELGDGYQPDEYIELVSVNDGWRAVALAQ